MTNTPIVNQRAIAALKNLFVADSLAMPLHWFYRTSDIFKAFPDGITSFSDAPAHHPSSIMSLHSTSQGGRKKTITGTKPKEIIGDVILKGKREFWDIPNIHYHHLMKAGDNTLNAHCARVVMRSLHENGGYYDSGIFLRRYIEFMTSETPKHNDTYAESYHRGFFDNLEKGKPLNQCGAKTHDTASIGGLVSIAPIVISERLLETPLDEVQLKCKEHLMLTHPDQKLAAICEHYVRLIDKLLYRTDSEPVQDIINKTSIKSIGLNLDKLKHAVKQDQQVVGNLYSSACYIQDSWPSTLYLAYRYHDDIKKALISNTNLGGDNVHRGCVLGVILGLNNGKTIEGFFELLLAKDELSSEIHNLI